jgi:predicted enzyme related to lactoylglutathione lyase
MPIVDKISMFHVAVTDADQAKVFYTETLGLKVTDDSQFGPNRWITLAMPDGGTYFTLTTVHLHMKPGTLQLYFSSPDVSASLQAVTTKGVKPVKEGHDWGTWDGQNSGGQWFEVTDPDGNHIVVIPA